MRHQPVDAHAVDLGAGDELEAPVAGVLEHRAVVHGPARSDVQRVGGVHNPLLGGSGEGGGGVVVLVVRACRGAGGAVGIGVGVRVEVQDHQLRMPAVRRAKLRQRHRAVAAEGHRNDAGVKEHVERRLDAAIALDDVAEHHVYVAAVDHPEILEQVHLPQWRLIGPHQRRLAPDLGRAEAGAETDRMEPAVERYPEDRRLRMRQLARGGHAHESADVLEQRSAEARIVDCGVHETPSITCGRSQTSTGRADTGFTLPSPMHSKFSGLCGQAEWNSAQ